MPELPEVETLRRQLKPLIEGRPIRGVDTFDPRLGDLSEITGEVIETVKRLGKRLEFLLSSRRALVLQLRMTGRLLWQEGYFLPSAHSRLALYFDTGTLELIDPRRFAMLSLCQPSRASFSLFPEEANLPSIMSLAKRRRITIKEFLLDQRLFPGVGNIYACEILHAARLSPERKVCDLNEARWRSIWEVGPTILERAIRRRGTTVSDWRDLFGAPGENQRFLNVYAREGEPCLRCGQPVVRRKIGGRGTYYCPTCQE
ncbi:MAG TPA: DNA-formamidopyrimidine glycosylase family protein [Syntrophales bacterium]|nr:DNA-formamidopyrimidine glycosylase family protein [Syntrophales bacterium]HOL58375.1 DNA-formamidopyrimidine glycosylase family protein [Syntrophales bacterium]HPO34544.1 DNA-formamidopyrimidine glycosylase family protein [Syntrophales bacterium]